MEFQGTLYRSISPRYADDPYSGQEAALYGGRFNAKGIHALYTSMELETCLFEASQTGGIFSRSTLVSYDAHYLNLFDSAVDATPEESAVLFSSDTWREDMDRAGISKSQELAGLIMNRDFAGMVVTSFEPRAAAAGGRNVVLWSLGMDLPHRLDVIGRPT